MVKHGKLVNEGENKELRQEDSARGLRRIGNPHPNFNLNH